MQDKGTELQVPNDQLFKVKSVAGMFTVSPATVYRLVESGELPALRFGTGKGALRIEGSAINAYLKARRVSGLTSAQACGVACVVCQADFVPADAPASMPVGAGARTQLFACAEHSAHEVMQTLAVVLGAEQTADAVLGNTEPVGEAA
jgi:excisionase family DNA binding protein